jgi:hypothetical protein
VREYPLSPLVPQAKDKLKALKAPVPQPDPKAVAWMTAVNNSQRRRDSFVKKPLALVNTRPRQELLVAAPVGTPTMTPESDNEAGVDILTGGNQSQIAGTGTGIVATVTPGSTAETTAGAENVNPPTDGGEAKPETQKPDAATPAAAGETTNRSTGTATGEAPAKAEGATEAAGTTNAAAKADGTAAPAGQTAEGTKPDSAQIAQADPQTGSLADKKDNKKESSSKKKKGLKRIIPW